MKPSTKREFKARLFGEFARVGKAFASPHRLHMLDVLAQGERTVEQLAAEVAAPVANVSQHLQVLRAARLVAVRRNGLFSHYSLADPQVFRAWQALRDLARSRLTEIDAVVAEYFGHRDGMDVIGPAELRRRMRAGDVVVLDVRPRPEYDAGHIRGARNVPFDELDARIREIPPDTEVVAYCRGPYCVFADEAAAILRTSGFRVRRLAEGYPDWQARGYPVQASTPTRKTRRPSHP